jgi:phosphoribosylanthranilate isomerase
MKIKVCGITSAGDALAAAQAGTDYVGLNFVGGPRRIDGPRAAAILDVLPDSVAAVALVDASGGGVPRTLHAILQRHGVRHLQLYGEIGPETVARLTGEGFRTWLVRHVRGDEFAADTGTFLDGCGPNGPAAVLLDAFDPARQGGTGRTVDWSRIDEARRAGRLDGWPPIVLAGGLAPDNVAQAIAAVRPWGVDVSSGVEESVGRKSPDKIRAFVLAAREVG